MEYGIAGGAEWPPGPAFSRRGLPRFAAGLRRPGALAVARVVRPAVSRAGGGRAGPAGWVRPGAVTIACLRARDRAGAGRRPGARCLARVIRCGAHAAWCRAPGGGRRWPRLPPSLRLAGPEQGRGELAGAGWRSGVQAGQPSVQEGEGTPDGVGTARAAWMACGAAGLPRFRFCAILLPARSRSSCPFGHAHSASATGFATGSPGVRLSATAVVTYAGRGGQPEAAWRGR
jgi:hypothetical protein